MPNRAGRRKVISNLNLFSDGERVINLDTEIADRTFHPRVAEQKLDCAQVARAAVDQGRLRSSKRVRAEDMRVKPDACDPFRDEACVLPRRHGLSGPPPAGEQEFAGLLAGGPQVVID